MSQPKSPAVEAYELDKALEDTFPASDPVSHSVTSVAGAPPAPEKADSGGVLDAIRVWVKDNPIAAVAVTAAVAWMIGSGR